MSAPPGAPSDLVARMLGGVEVDAALDLQIDDGAGGASGGRVSASVDGGVQTVRVDLDRPDVALAAVPRTVPGGLSAVRAVARRYGDTPWRVEIRGPRGLLASVDPDRSSRIALLLTGSPHVRINPRAARAVPAAGVAVGVAVGVVVLAGLAAIAVARGRRHTAGARRRP